MVPGPFEVCFTGIMQICVLGEYRSFKKRRVGILSLIFPTKISESSSWWWTSHSRGMDWWDTSEREREREREAKPRQGVPLGSLHFLLDCCSFQVIPCCKVHCNAGHSRKQRKMGRDGEMANYSRICCHNSLGFHNVAGKPQLNGHRPCVIIEMSHISLN